MTTPRIVDRIWFRLFLLLAIFLTSVLWLWFLVNVLRPSIDNMDSKEIRIPEIEQNQDRSKRDSEDTLEQKPSMTISFPSNLQELKQLSEILGRFSQINPQYVFILFCSAYLFKQTFAIPGSVFLNLLGGAIYGTWLGFPLCCLLTASGATCCYFLSKMAGQAVLERFFPEKLAYFRQKIWAQQHQKSAPDGSFDHGCSGGSSLSLLWILISLRLFPMTPNWFLNMVSPMVRIPVTLFFASVLFGLMPYNFICVQTGSILSKLTTMDDVFTIKTFVALLFIAIVVATPSLLNKFIDKSRPMDQVANHLKTK